MSELAKLDIVTKLYAGKEKYADLWVKSGTDEYSAEIGGKNFEIERRSKEGSKQINYVIWLVDPGNKIAGSIFASSLAKESIDSPEGKISASQAITSLYDYVKAHLESKKVDEFLKALDD